MFVFLFHVVFLTTTCLLVALFMSIYRWRNSWQFERELRKRFAQPPTAYRSRPMPKVFNAPQGSFALHACFSDVSDTTGGWGVRSTNNNLRNP